jgi:hypothetical protein
MGLFVNRVCSSYCTNNRSDRAKRAGILSPQLRSEGDTRHLYAALLRVLFLREAER